MRKSKRTSKKLNQNWSNITSPNDYISINSLNVYKHKNFDDKVFLDASSYKHYKNIDSDESVSTSASIYSDMHQATKNQFKYPASNIINRHYNKLNVDDKNKYLEVNKEINGRDSLYENADKQETFLSSRSPYLDFLNDVYYESNVSDLDEVKSPCSRPRIEDRLGYLKTPVPPPPPPVFPVIDSLEQNTPTMHDDKYMLIDPQMKQVLNDDSLRTSRKFIEKRNFKNREGDVGNIWMEMRKLKLELMEIKKQHGFIDDDNDDLCSIFDEDKMMQQTFLLQCLKKSADQLIREHYELCNKMDVIAHLPLTNKYDVPRKIKSPLNRTQKLAQTNLNYTNNNKEERVLSQAGYHDNVNLNCNYINADSYTHNSEINNFIYDDKMAVLESQVSAQASAFISANHSRLNYVTSMLHLLAKIKDNSLWQSVLAAVNQVIGQLTDEDRLDEMSVNEVTESLMDINDVERLSLSSLDASEFSSMANISGDEYEDICFQEKYIPPSLDSKASHEDRFPYKRDSTFIVEGKEIVVEDGVVLDNQKKEEAKGMELQKDNQSVISGAYSSDFEESSLNHSKNEVNSLDSKSNEFNLSEAIIDEKKEKNIACETVKDSDFVTIEFIDSSENLIGAKTNSSDSSWDKVSDISVDKSSNQRNFIEDSNAENPNNFILPDSANSFAPNIKNLEISSHGENTALAFNQEERSHDDEEELLAVSDDMEINNTETSNEPNRQFVSGSHRLSVDLFHCQDIFKQFDSTLEIPEEILEDYSLNSVEDSYNNLVGEEE